MARSRRRARGRNGRGGSPFRGAVSRNIAQRKQRGGYPFLRIPNGVPVFREQPKTRVDLDILPYTVTERRHPDRDEEFNVAVEGSLWYKRPYLLHRSLSSDGDAMVCLGSVGQRCPICDYRTQLMNEGADWQDDTVRALRPSRRNLYVVVPRGHKDYEEVPHIWNISEFLFQDQLNEEIQEDERYETFPDLEEGYTLRIRFAEEQFAGNKFAKTSRVDFRERKRAIGDDIIEQIPNLDEVLIIPTAESIQEAFFGGTDTGEDSSEDDYTEDDFDDDPFLDDDDGDDEDPPFDSDEEEDEEEESPPPARRRRRAEKADSSNKCPAGHRFGKDVDEFDECDDCPVWEECMDAYEAEM